MQYLQPVDKVFLQTNSKEHFLIHYMMIYKIICMYFFFFLNHVKNVIWLIAHLDGLFNFHVVGWSEIDLEINFSHLKMLQLSMFVQEI